MAKLTVTAKKGATQFLIRKPLTVAVDGEERSVEWGGSVDIDVAPGAHTVEAHFRYMGRDAGKASASVDVGPDGTTVGYKAPLGMTSKGNLTVD